VSERVARLLAKKVARKARKQAEAVATEEVAPASQVEEAVVEEVALAPEVPEEVVSEQCVQLDGSADVSPTVESLDAATTEVPACELAAEPTPEDASPCLSKPDSADVSTEDEVAFETDDTDDMEKEQEIETSETEPGSIDEQPGKQIWADEEWQEDDFEGEGVEVLEEKVWEEEEEEWDFGQCHNGWAVNHDEWTYDHRDCEVVDDSWMVPLDEVIRDQGAAKFSYAMQDITGTAPPAALEYRPVLGDDGSQLYTNGNEFFVLAALEPLDDVTHAPGVRMTPMVNPQDPVHQMLLDVCSPCGSSGQSPQVASWDEDKLWNVSWAPTSK